MERKKSKAHSSSLLVIGPPEPWGQSCRMMADAPRLTKCFRNGPGGIGMRMAHGHGHMRRCESAYLILLCHVVHLGVGRCRVVT